ncbi:hypothetical protein AAFF_G00141540 [Aldrovandia affinis]|uniref:Uncharacterized protein n=1 Tax=Aldrovandia affinis TaxID=143900 RepID=A0AAD7TCH7_9TELE|nr:hypothetical protein AAFF_G00141540 [Aldrovandia affinis]
MAWHHTASCHSGVLGSLAVALFKDKALKPVDSDAQGCCVSRTLVAATGTAWPYSLVAQGLALRPAHPPAPCPNTSGGRSYTARPVSCSVGRRPARVFTKSDIQKRARPYNYTSCPLFLGLGFETETA